MATPQQNDDVVKRSLDYAINQTHKFLSEYVTQLEIELEDALSENEELKKQLKQQKKEPTREKNEEELNEQEEQLESDSSQISDESNGKEKELEKEEKSINYENEEIAENLKERLEKSISENYELRTENEKLVARVGRRDQTICRMNRKFLKMIDKLDEDLEKRDFKRCEEEIRNLRRELSAPKAHDRSSSTITNDCYHRDKTPRTGRAEKTDREHSRGAPNKLKWREAVVEAKKLNAGGLKFSNIIMCSCFFDTKCSRQQTCQRVNEIPGSLEEFEEWADKCDVYYSRKVAADTYNSLIKEQKRQERLGIIEVRRMRRH